MSLRTVFQKLLLLINNLRVGYLGYLYFIHLRIRYLHDLTYKKGGVYKKWTDKKYSESIHRAAFASFMVSFVIFSLAQSLFPYLFNPAKPQKAMAGANSVTWTTTSHFTNNGAVDSNYTGASTASNINSSDDSLTLNSQEALPNVNIDTTFLNNNRGIAVNEISGKLYIANPTSNYVRVYNTADNSYVTAIYAQNASHVAVNKNTNKIYVSKANNTGAVYVIDGVTNTITNTISVGALPLGLEVNPVTNKIYVANQNGKSVSVIDGATETVTATISTGTNLPSSVAVNTASNLIYVTLPAASQFIVISGTLNTVTNTISSGGSWPMSIAFNAVNNRILVANQTDNNVKVFNTSYAVVATISVGAAPAAIAINTNNNKAYVANYVGGSVSVINCSTNTVTETVSAYSPGNLAVNISNYKIYVGSGDSKYITVLSRAFFSSPGVLSNIRIDSTSGLKFSWATVSWTGDFPANTSAKVRTRGTNVASPGEETLIDQANPDNGWTVWSPYITTSGNAINTDSTRWLEVEVTLTSTDDSVGPTLNDFTVTYDNLEAPSNSNLTFKKSDGTNYLKTTGGTIMPAGTTGGFTSEDTVKLTATGLTCTDCASSTNRRIQVETKLVGTDFDETGLVEGDSQAGGATSTATINGLVEGNYHSRVRAIDDEGRVSGWTAYGNNAENVTDFTVERSVPTITDFSVNSGSEYTSNRLINVTANFNDTDRATGLLYAQFSEDGVNWGIYNQNPSSPGNNKGSNWTNTRSIYAQGESTLNSAWYVEKPDDGSVTIYIRIMDTAGNVSGTWTQTTDADFNAGTKNNITGESDSIRLSSIDNTNWVVGRAGTAMAGKQVYNQNLFSDYAWRTPANANCIGPQCAVGLDSNYPGNVALVADNAVDFSLYPARNACKTINARLPYMNELLEIYAGRASYGNNFTSNKYWSATVQSYQSSTLYIMAVNFADGTIVNGWNGSNGFPIRCVRNDPGAYSSSGNFVSTVKNFGTQNIKHGVVNFNVNIPANTTITLEARAGNVAIPDGTWTNYYALNSGQDAPTELNGHQYLQYKATLTGDGNVTPTLYDITFNGSVYDSINLDSQAPAAFSLSSPATNLWQQSNAPTLTWGASSDGNGIAKYQIYVDGVLNRDNIDGAATSSTPSPVLSAKMSSWKIRAYDVAGNYTDSSETWNIGYDALVPSLILDPGFNFLATDTNADDITLSWNTYADDSGNGSPASTYALERITYLDYVGGSHTLTSNWSTAASYTDLGNKTSPVIQAKGVDIVEATRYVYRIKVMDAAGNVSNWIDSDTGLTADVVPPTPGPRDVVAGVCDGASNCSNVANKGYEIKLTWTEATDNGSGITGYKIYRKASTNSINPADFAIVGYLDLATPNAPVTTEWYDNDANNDATFTDTIAGESVNVKSSPSTRLNDSTQYHYRITAIDDAGYESDVINMVYNNYALDNDVAPTTPDVTNPTASAEVSGSAMGIDGQPVPEGEDAKQKIDVSWTAAVDNNNQSRTPNGPGSGIRRYSLYYATSSGLSGALDPETIETWNLIASDIGPVTPSVSYSHVQLNELTWYYYKVVAEDNSNLPSEGRFSPISYSSAIKTLSSQVPTTVTNVNVSATKGNPNTVAAVGESVAVSFKSSYIKYSKNKITGYEVYRSTTNHNNSADWLAATKLTLPQFENLNVTGLDVVNEEVIAALPTLNFTDTVPADATTYYYKIRTVGFNPDMEPTTVYSGLSNITTGSLNVGWDTVPDDTPPSSPAALKVKDIHPDGENYFRNIVTWERVADPLRNGVNDFKEYRLYRSNDGLTWSQILEDGQNPLLKETQELSLANNYYIDLIPVAQSNQYFYYYVTAVDNAATEFKYSTAGAPVINEFSNESTVPEVNGVKDSVSLNPYIAFPTITTLESGKKAAVSNVNVSSAVITWTTDQNCDSLVEYRKAGTSDAFIAVGDRNMRTSHSVRIFDLDPSTTYEYRAISRNSLANEDTAEGAEVPTLTTNGFTITPGSVSTTTSTVEIKWTTNLDAKSNFVEYQLQRQPGDEAQTGIAGELGEQASLKDHTVVIKGLRSSRTYTYKIKSISQDDFLAETTFLTFKTKSFDSSQLTMEPNSSNIAEKNISATTAQIIWNTGFITTSWVDFGTASGVYDYSAGDNNLTTTHVVKLENLQSGTVYFYRVRGKDNNEQEFTSKEYSFRAIAKPKISNIQIKEVKPYEVTVSWETNVATDTLLNWGTTAAYGTRVGKSESTKNHEIKVENLFDDTSYHYQIVARDEYGNEVVDEDKTVRTPLDTAGPKINNVKTDLMPLGDDAETAQVIISWETDKPASTLVQYDEGVIGGKYGKSTTEDLSLNGSHTVIIKELLPATTYHYRIVTKDKRGNTTISNDYTFVTPTKEKSILQLIIKSLEETFSWVKNVGTFFRDIGKKTK